jgi:hypothetical protein
MCDCPTPTMNSFSCSMRHSFLLNPNVCAQASLSCQTRLATQICYCAGALVCRPPSVNVPRICLNHTLPALPLADRTQFQSHRPSGHPVKHWRCCTCGCQLHCSMASQCTKWVTWLCHLHSAVHSLRALAFPQLCIRLCASMPSACRRSTRMRHCCPYCAWICFSAG